MHAYQLHMCSLCLLNMFLLCIHGGGHCCRCVAMWKLMMLLLECVFHECMSIVYAFVMHVSVYSLLCMHCHGYGYACMVGQTCIVRSLYAIRSSWCYWYVMVLMSWLR